MALCVLRSGERTETGGPGGREVANGNAGLGAWTRFRDPVATVEARSFDEVERALRSVQEAVDRDGLTAVGFVCYEAAPGFDSACSTRARETNSVPLLWFSLYGDRGQAEYETLDEALGRSPTGESGDGAGNAILEAEDTQADRVQVNALEWDPTIDPETYLSALREIKARIEAGDTYQVNFSYRLRARTARSSRELFAAMYAAQPAELAAYIEHEDWAICSVSPELFFAVRDGSVEMRPMKGTIARGRTLDEDREQASSLLHSEKDRAENLMITDMMRNDIGRVARPGSVGVPKLFALEKYPTLWQMTSTVRAQSDASPAEIFAALFPCASITGAPKLRTMEIIAALEDTPRGVYTGAVGTIAPGGRARFSVAIRTACLSRATGEAEYGVGGGIVWDSVPERELEESRLKGAVLSERVPEFELLETIRWRAEEGFWLLNEHLERLAASAEYFAIPFDPQAFRGALEDAVAGKQYQDARIRLRLSPDGAFHTEVSPYEATATPWSIRPATHPVDSSNRFLYHKTTHRAPYLRARESVGDCNDVLLWNETGYVTETSVANLVARIDGRLVTPPVSCGLLAGTYRARLLREGSIVEYRIHLSELGAASELYLVNSLRGWIPARMVS